MTALAQDVRTLCEDDSYLFHAPDEREAPAVKAARENAAKAICARCPLAIKESCLNLAMEAEHGLTAQHRNGIYGGLTEQERADLDAASDDGTHCNTCGRDFTSRSARTQHATIAHTPEAQDRVETIRRMAASGHSDIEIAETVGLSPDVVGRTRRRYGIKPGVEPTWRAS